MLAPLNVFFSYNYTFKCFFNVARLPIHPIPIPNTIAIGIKVLKIISAGINDTILENTKNFPPLYKFLQKLRINFPLYTFYIIYLFVSTLSLDGSCIFMYNDFGGSMKDFFKNGKWVIITFGLLFVVLIVCADVFFFNTRYEHIEYDKTQVAKLEYEKININTAKAEDFYALGEIGEKVADKIVDYREDNGDFDSVDEIGEIDGIGKTTFEKIKPFLTI